MSALIYDVVIVGSGPAALMAASCLSGHNLKIAVVEKKKGPGKKLLIAGASGLNITHDHPQKTFYQFYKSPHFKKIFDAFSPNDWIGFINDLGIETFKGTSRRYFVKGLKATPLLTAWIDNLKKSGVDFYYDNELLDFNRESYDIFIKTKKNLFKSKAVCLALGGASYEPDESPLRWVSIFKRKQIKFAPFEAENVGYEVDWSKKFVEEAEGLPIKNCELTTKKGRLKGDMTITRYGLEGTPVYTMGCAGQAFIDLKPDLTETQILKKLSASKEKLTGVRLIKKVLGLHPAGLALLFHETTQAQKKDAKILAMLTKRFPVSLKKKRPLEEAISSSGGVMFDEVDSHLMLKKFPGVFLAGEMLDWTAPTGGFLIQACVSQGYVAGKGVLGYLKK